MPDPYISAEAAYAGKPNIVRPGTSGQATTAASIAATRLADHPDRQVFGAQTINVDANTDTNFAIPGGAN